MKIYLDTNAIYDDYLLNSPRMRLLEHHILHTLTDQLCISEVVIEEAIRHYKRAYEHAVASDAKNQEIFQAIGIDNTKVIEFENAVILYRKLLMKRLKDLNARILPIPTISLQDVFSRDIKERKPFKNSGKESSGFMDVLIWESILEDLKAHSHTGILISADSGFANPADKEKLNSDLILDLNEHGISEGRLLIRNSLRTFMDEFSLPVPVGVYRLGQVIEGTFVENLNPTAVLRNNNPHMLVEIQGALGGLLEIVCEVGITKLLREPEDVRLLEARDVGEGIVFATVRARLTLDTEIYSSFESHRELLGLTRNNPVIVMDLRLDDEDYITALRLSLFADFVFVWDAHNDEGYGIDLAQLGFSENNMSAVENE